MRVLENDAQRTQMRTGTVRHDKLRKTRGRALVVSYLFWISFQRSFLFLFFSSSLSLPVSFSLCVYLSLPLPCLLPSAFLSRPISILFCRRQDPLLSTLDDSDLARIMRFLPPALFPNFPPLPPFTPPTPYISSNPTYQPP